MIKNKNVSLSKGIDIIKNELLTIPKKSGVYQMIGENSEYLYIGKAKNLNNKNFKLAIKGELSLELLHSFVSLDINRVGNSLQLIKYEVIEKNLSKNN